MGYKMTVNNWVTVVSIIIGLFIGFLSVKMPDKVEPTIALLMIPVILYITFGNFDPEF